MYTKETQLSTIDAIIDYARKLEMNDLPSEIVQSIKIHTLDTLAAIVAGSSSETSKKLVTLIKKWGGRAEGTIFVYGERTVLPNAAWANSTMARGFDFESLLPAGATHSPASIIPAAFAFAEYSKKFKNKAVSGKEFIVAVVLGLDLNYRFRVAGGEATLMGGGWLAETFSPLAIAALGGRILDFDEEKIRHAMGIAYNQCCGTYGAVLGELGGCLAQLSQGLGTKAGVLSVLLADNGFTASKEDIIDGKWGLYNMYGNGIYDRQALLNGLGKRFDHLNPVIKKYPGCGAIQVPVNTALEILKEHHIKIGNLSKVKIKVSMLNYKQVVHGRSFPSTIPDMLWNLRFAIATAIVRNKFFVDDLTKRTLTDPQILEVFNKIEVMPCDFPEEDVEMEITLRNGKTYQRKGSTWPQMSKQRIIKKFKDCYAFSARPLPKSSEVLINIMEKLEKLKDVCKIIDLLTHAPMRAIRFKEHGVYPRLLRE